MTVDDHADDQARAHALARARAVLDAAGADRLAPRPWQSPGRPTSDGELVRFAAWETRAPTGGGADVLEAGLRLLAPARAELDQLEAGLLFAARSAGMTWPQVAAALGLASAQAAQQRMARVLGRVPDGAAS